MENNIKIFDSQELGVQAVSARVLYNELADGDMSNYSRWAKKNIIENDFADSSCDYITRHNDEYSGRGQKATDYILTLDFAKELCMMSKCEKGKIIRKYFIDCEKKLKQQPALPNFNNPAEAARAWADQYEKNQKLLAENIEMKPKVDFYNDVTGSTDTIDIAGVSKVLNIPNMGRNKLFAFLREKNILNKRNEPYQYFVDKGYFRQVESKWEHDGTIHINLKTVVFQKGLDFIRKLVLEHKN